MRKILIASAFILAGAALQAQNLNPVVEVTNTYAREATGIEKPSQLLPLPDSVYKFNLDFDYSVTNPTYKGAYEFHPYLVQMKPGARLSPEQKFYLSAGAGYSLHPELDLVWNPVRKENFRMNVYAGHNSYFGPHRWLVNNQNVYVWDGTSVANGAVRAESNAGTDFLYIFNGGRFTADLNYRNILAKDFYQAATPELKAHHRGQLKLRVQNAPGARFLYDVGTRVAYLGSADGQELHTVSDASFGFKAVRLGLGLETASFDQGTVLKGELSPHYTLNRKRLTLDLGVKLSYVISPVLSYPYKGGYIFPDVKISYRVADAVVLQAAATGGDRLVTYDSILESNPYLGSFDWIRDVTVNRVDVMGGIRGSVASRFSYDLRAGFNWTDNAFSWSYGYTGAIVSAGGSATTMAYVPTVAFVSSLKTVYASLALQWLSSAWDASARVYYGYTPIPALGNTVAEQSVFAPARFKASGHVFYSWLGRIKAGVTVEARSAMKGKNGSIPAFQDLGVYAEYAFNRHMAFWLKGGNLLNQSIQRIPFYAEGGIYGTAGIKLVF